MNESNIKNEELRKKPRFPSTATLTIVNPDTAEIIEGSCIDVSETGLKVTTHVPLVIGEDLSLSIIDKGVIFYAIGNVIYCNQIEDVYEVGFHADFNQTLPSSKK